MYKVPLTSNPVSYDIKKSRFIGLTQHLSNIEQFNDSLARTKADWPGATHYAWAYRLPDGTDKASDDGEPHGTAGLPLLNLLTHRNLCHTLITVVRYFGGIKLGHGGLVHAYQKAGQLAIDNTTWGLLVPALDVQMTVPYHTYNMVKNVLDNRTTNFHATFDTEVTLSFRIIESQSTDLFTRIQQLTAGAAELKLVTPLWDVAKDPAP
ncbi:MAG: YigZ family protein [Firmicutes bacterium]|nr:YigZ family protein [Bacillota bacterium]MCL5971007.1 YigZ family protein [Bacillota bacterium]